MALIVTNCAEQICRKIDAVCQRGTTIIGARGGYQGTQKQIVMCACSNKEMYQVQKIAKEVDAQVKSGATKVAPLLKPRVGDIFLQMSRSFCEGVFCEKPYLSRPFYSRWTPLASQASIISLDQTAACTSPMCTLLSISMQMRDCPIPPPIVRGSCPSRSIL